MLNLADRDALEAVGQHYNVSTMLNVRQMTRNAILDIARQIKPGMVEEDALELAKDVLAEREMLKGWHGVFVRFGANTTKTFGAPSQPGRVLGEDDIFFIDIGPTWREWEGDGGQTFVTGADPEKTRCAADSKAIFHEVRNHWLKTGATGKVLYQFAVDATERRGWQLNLDLNGHRLSDFPHSAVYGGAMSDIEFTPSSQLWVLEIHIRNQAGTFGAFFEDMLLEDEYFNDF
ncbi:M24 family metallopeptidase [Pseudomonas sp. ICMP 460]|uniref:M24 family metallopeptidase n=1 Tax=Pseudomonas sp. ICMP 460 TaxID=1718917 RepID=UPI000C07D72D|nr:M24 family metallopeptidase [Pseudomonas sp. ICMP 460]PHN30465.1 (Fe-S)-binding protein [Pseudomonas sp. ICMP 460]